MTDSSVMQSLAYRILNCKKNTLFLN